jgi:3-oxoacyl-[acyl-carrier protein] reductase/meso-butanediol dehydrogenase/(S,S)-butanediol dehydrogenase/diacetyl reductase
LYDLNVKSYIAVTQGLVVLMKEGASIINISSMAGKRGTKNNSVYCATKFAVNGLTQSWAKELGERGIRVNAVCPVLVASQGLFDALIMRDAPAEKMSVSQFMADFSKSQTALGFLPLADDVAEFCAGLIGKRALSGQCINLDCGVFPQ